MPGKGWSFTGKIHQKVCDKAQLSVRIRSKAWGEVMRNPWMHQNPANRPSLNQRSTINALLFFGFLARISMLP